MRTAEALPPVPALGQGLDARGIISIRVHQCCCRRRSVPRPLSFLECPSWYELRQKASIYTTQPTHQRTFASYCCTSSYSSETMQSKRRSTLQSLRDCIGLRHCGHTFSLHRRPALGSKCKP